MADSRLYREIAEKRNILRNRYGGLMTLDQVRQELGYHSPKSARAAVQELGLPATQIGKMKRYDTDILAKRLVELRGMAN